MAPKKGGDTSEKLLLGRPSNNLKIGVVGLPNVGKSTLFNALTSSFSEAANFPFCTIKPAEGRVPVPDIRFDWLCDSYKPASKVPAFLTVIDIAGLVKGAAEGAGLGNNFLSEIRAVDGIFHVVRCFSGGDIVHVEGEVDPIRDLSIISNELRLKDIEFLEKHIEQLKKTTSRASSQSLEAKQKKEELEVCEQLLTVVKSGKDVRHEDWGNRQIEIINTLFLLSAKPMIYLANVSEKDYARKKNKYLAKIKEWVDANSPGDMIVPFSADLESKLASEENEESKKLYLESVGEGVASCFPKIITSGYKILRLHYFFTAGPDEVRAWTIRQGTKAPQAAGVIHSDMMRGFIMAEVMRFADLKEAGSEADVKAAGKYLQKGKEYVLEDGDICYFKFNVTATGKKK